MSYYIAQFLGILVTVGVIVTLQIKNKIPMQIVSIAVNALSAANILLLNGFNSGVIVCSVAVFSLSCQSCMKQKIQRSALRKK